MGSPPRMTNTPSLCHSLGIASSQETSFALLSVISPSMPVALRMWVHVLVLNSTDPHYMVTVHMSTALSISMLSVPVLSGSTRDPRNKQGPTIMRTPFLPPEVRRGRKRLRQPLVRSRLRVEYLGSPSFPFVHDARVLELLDQRFFSSARNSQIRTTFTGSRFIWTRTDNSHNSYAGLFRSSTCSYPGISKVK